MDNESVIKKLEEIIQELKCKKLYTTPIRNIIFESDDSILMTGQGGGHIVKIKSPMNDRDLDSLIFEDQVLLYTTSVTVRIFDYERVINYLTNYGYRVKKQENIYHHVELVK